MSDILSIIKERRSIRRYQDKAIPPELIEKFKEALISASSAGNLGSRKFYFVFNQAVKEQLANTHGRTRWFILEAHLVIVGCADEKKVAEKYGDRGKNL